MNNYLGSGITLDLPAPVGGCVSGEAYLFGGMLAVANVTAAEGEIAAFSRTGMYTLPKATGAAWVVGDTLYWNSTSRYLTKTATDNTKVGVAIAAAAAGDTVGKALLPGII